MNVQVPTPPAAQPTSPLLTLLWDQANWSLTLTASAYLLIIVALFGILLAAWRLYTGGLSFKNFEIDQAEIGVGTGRFRFKPNITDKQVAYAVWVELSTRKIGLPIDFDNDIVSEIYDSWFNFFTVTRELIKSIPANQVKRSSTQAIIKLSIEVLNGGLRPHLTQWQARFRHWYDRELKKYDEGKGPEVLDPQAIQEKFPKFADLKKDMERVNQSLIRYRSKMHELVLKD
ncbi:hypothetical protein FJ970_10480 [Mesorhizobium sp. B2-1-8]|uniref:hypothetical protein n=1 Tax=Mesorhizobium sp. B2-1-8 TaxID=2589967 RepID=UPI001AEDE47D|nr:hypothetical protein [Mesorhizobium sp. B2-1-8]UCI21348.1 hypothetical protein FJ970_10480 [Mesorhizobium sp. B2-1-8]